MANQYDREARLLERRRQLAEALRASGNEALPASLQTGGRFDAPVSGWQHANKALQQILGGLSERQINKAEKELTERQAKAQADWMRGLSEAQAPSELQPVAPTGQLMDTGGDMSALKALDLDPAAAIGAREPVGLQEQIARRVKGAALRGDVQQQVDAGDRQKLLAHYMKGGEVGGLPAQIGAEGVSRTMFPPAKKIDRVDVGDKIAVYEDGKLTGYEQKGASPDAAANLAAANARQKATDDRITSENKLNREQAAELARLQRETTMRGQDLRTDIVPSKGYRWKADGSGEQELIPGSPQAVKLEAQLEKEEASKKSVDATLNAEIANIDKLIGSEDGKLAAHPGLGSLTGSIESKLPTFRQDTRNAEELLNSLKSKASINALREIRAGGSQSIGQITEREWPRLEGMKVALSEGQSEEQLTEQLKEYRSELVRMKRDTGTALDGFKTQATQPPTAALPPGVTEEEWNVMTPEERKVFE